MNSEANNTHTTTDRDDEETTLQSSHREWVEDHELRQQELDRLAVEMFLRFRVRAIDNKEQG
jgi:hypothetical protein